MVRGNKQKSKKRKLNRKVKIALFFFFVSVLLLAGFSFWGKDVQLGKGFLTGAVTGELGGGISLFAVPTIDSIAINSTLPLNNNTNQNITAHVTTSDTDGDVVKVIYNWYLNDTSIAIFNLPLESSPPYNATDYSGNGNHGDPNKSIGDPPVWNESIGYDGRGAYNFTTTDQYIGLGLSTYTSDRGTIAVWIKSYEVAIGADRWIFGRNQGGNVNGDIGLEWQNVNDTLTFFIQNGATTVEAQSNAVFGDTDWHLLVGTWSTTEIALYIDGVKNGNDTGMTLNAHANGFSFAIGNINGGDALAQSFPGVIDDVVFYNRTLSEEQIIAIYQNRTDIITSGETSQDDRWNFSATPNDGFDDGATTYSENITIEAVPGCGYVNSDLTLVESVNANATCFIINASNIVIDGQSFIVTGNDTGYGFNISGYNNTTIKNVNFYNFSIGGFVSKSVNNTILNNSINVTSSYGLQLEAASDNNNITSNDLLNTSGRALFIDSSDQTTIDGNTITVIDIEAIYLQGADNNNASNNLITLTGTGVSNVGAFYLTSTAVDNQMINNTINSTRQAGHGVLTEGSARIDIINNTFHIDATHANGIYLKGAQNNNNISGNDFNIHGNNGDALLIDGSSGNLVTNNSLVVDGGFGHGFAFDTLGGRNNFFGDNDVQVAGQDAHAINFVSSSSVDSNNFTNNILNSSEGNFTFAQATNSGGGRIYFTNNTGNKYNVGFHSTNKGELVFRWYLTANVSNSTGQIDGANVTGFNQTNDKEYTNTTGANGIATLILTDFIQNSSTNIVYWTPSTINTSFTGFLTNTTTINLTATNSTQINLILAVDTTPSVAINTPAERENFTTGDTIVFNASISDDSGTNPHTVFFQLENGTNGLVNVTPSTTNNTLFNFSITIGSGVAEGNRTVTIFANDTAGNMNNSVSRTFFVDQTAPNATVTCSPSSVTVGGTVTCSCAGEDDQSSGVNSVSFSDISPSTATAGTLTTGTCTVTDNVGINANATGSYTVTAATESAGSSGDSGGGSAPARGEAPAETAPAAPSEEQAIVTAEELRALIRNQRFTINIAPIVRIVEATAPTISRADSVLTGRAIGAPPARPVERRSLTTTRQVSITFTNRADRAVSIVPIAREQSQIQLPDQQRAEHIIEEKIRAVLAAEARQLTEKEMAQRIAETIETVKIVDEENVQFISTTRALARQKGIFFLPAVDGSVSYSGGHTTGRLLKPEILDPDETIVPPGQTITKNYTFRLPITTDHRPITLTLASGGEDVQNQTINVTEPTRIGTALSLDPEQGIIDVYILIPKGGESFDTVRKRYVLEFNINEGRSFFFSSSKYSEAFGPYEIKRDQIFAQELQYNREIYQEELPVSLKIYEEGELIVENDYTVDFKAGMVREGVKPSLFTGLVMTGRAIFAGLDPKTQTYGSYLLDGILLLVLILLMVTGIAYLRQVTLSTLPHRPLPGMLSSKIAPYIPPSIRSAFLTKELSKIRTNLSMLEEEEVRLLLRQREKIDRLELQREEREITSPKPTIIPYPERHVLFREELQDVEKLIRSVEKMPLSQVKIKTTIPAVSPAQDIRERKKIIERELETVTGVLAAAEKRPTSLSAFFSRKRRPTIFDDELRNIDRRIGAVESLPEKHGRMKTTIPTLSPAVARWEIIQERKKAIDKELQRVTGDLARAERRPSSLLDRLLAGKRTRETKAARTALKDVLRINRKIGSGEQGNELTEIEKQLAHLDKMKRQKVKMRTVIPSMKEIVRQVEYERARLREERTAIENLLENKAVLNRKTTAVHVKKTKELEEIERALGAVETMPTARSKMRTAIPVLPPATTIAARERRSSIDAELREITSTLTRAETKPASLLGSLFGRKQKREKKSERDALKDVLRIARRIEKSGARAGNELVDIERELARVDKTGGQKVRLRETIPAAAELKEVIKEEKDLIEEKAAIEHLLAGIAGRHASAAANKKEQLRMKELAVIERTLKETDDSPTQRLKIAREIPAGQRKTTEPAWLRLLRSPRAEKSEEMHLKAERPPQTRELKAIEHQLETLDTIATARMKIRRFLPSKNGDLQANMQNIDEDTRLAEEKQAIREILEKVAARHNTPKARMKREEKKRELTEIQKAIERVEKAPLQPVRMKTHISNPEKKEGGRSEEAGMVTPDGERLTSSLRHWLWGGKGRKRKKKNENITEPAPEQQAYSQKTDHKQPKQNKELQHVQEKLRRLDRPSAQETRRVNVRTHIPPTIGAAVEVFEQEMNDLQQKRRDQRGWLRQTFQFLKSSPAERKREKMMVHELRDIDSSLAKVEEIMNRRKKGKVLRNVPERSVLEPRPDPDQIVRRRVSERLRIQKRNASPELKEIERELEHVEQEAPKKVAMRMTIPTRKELPRLDFEEIRKIAEASGRFDTTGLKERRKIKKSKELGEIEEKLEKLD
ncbi:right-handed parallel beta-helix repeat-containing protein [Candidatus Woesearchaeota archaeon]|nr:right-handed parallel beta-helix repeat-containing protein [Candidatus Woesearchaeota archaeon]